IGNRNECGTNKLPDRVSTGSTEVVLYLTPLFLMQSLIPPCAGIIIMGTRIHDTIADMVVRQVCVGRPGTEGELQNLHAGKPEMIPEGFDPGGNHAQVFGNYG